MKKLLSAILLLISVFAFGQRSDILKVQTIIGLKTQNTSAAFVYVADSAALYSVCSPCTADEVYIFAGTGGKNWKVMARGILSDASLMKYADTATAMQPYRDALNLKQNRGLNASKGAFLGDSEFAAGWGGPRMDSLVLTGSDTAIGNTIKSHAVGGHTIAQQQALYLADADRANYNWVLVAVGLNDVWSHTEAASVALGRYQTLINNIRSNSPKATIIVAAMQPVRKVYFANNSQATAQAMYAKWYLMNQGIMGVGPNAITNVDYRIDEYSKALGDSIGNLASVYDVGDFLHTNTAGRKVVAGYIRKALNQAGYLNNRTFSQPDQYLNFADSNVAVLKVPHLQINGKIKAINTPTSGTIADSALCRNPANGEYEMRKLPPGSGGDVEEASNNNFTGNNTVSNTGSWTFFNTTDQATNTEYAKHSWASNVYSIDVNKLGTGSLRNLEIKANNSTITIGTHSVAGGALDINKSGSFFNTFSVRGNNTLSSGIFSAGAIYPTINQSGTASYTGLFMAPYEQTMGSGQSYFVRLMKSGSANAAGPLTDYYHIKNDGSFWTTANGEIGGNLTVTGTITNTALTNAINAKADANNANLTGTPLAPTAASGTNTTQIATTAFVTAAVASGGVTLDATPTNGNTTHAVTSDGTHDAIEAVKSAPGVTQVKWFTSPVVNATTSWADVTGCSFPVTSGKTYRFKFTAWFRVNAQTTGSKWSITGPTFSKLDYYSQADNDAGLLFTAGVQGYDDAQIVVTTNSNFTPTNSNRSVVEGMITVTATDNLTLRFASEVAVANAVTADWGWVEFTEMP